MNPFYKILEQISADVAANKPPKKIMNVEELAKYTGFSKSYIYKICSQRKLPHSKPMGKQIFFRRNEIDAWLLGNPVPTIEQLSGHFNRFKTIKK